MLAVQSTCAAATAGEADVIGASAARAADGTYRFSATLSHADTGWEHYADRWDVVAPDGMVLASRVLHHPHVTEQPFTRSLGGVTVPDGVGFVVIRAHDKVHGTGGAEFRLELPK